MLRLSISCACCDRVDLPAMFGGKGIEHAEEHVSLVIGDVMQPFPESVQKAGVDTLVMKHFLSAFNDKDASLILNHCSQVLAPQGKILLLQVCALCSCCWLLRKNEQSLTDAMIRCVLFSVCIHHMCAYYHAK